LGIYPTGVFQSRWLVAENLLGSRQSAGIELDGGKPVVHREHSIVFVLVTGMVPYHLVTVTSVGSIETRA
jgi:hypothetical protein